MSTDGKQRRWIYVTPLHNHHQNNETKGNDVSGHTGNKRTVSNATIPITTLSTVHHTNNLYKNFNHNNHHKVNNIKNVDNVIRNGNILSRTHSNTRQNVQDDNEKLDVEKLSHIELEKAEIHKNFQQSNNGITNKSNDEYRNIGEYQKNVGRAKAFLASFEKDENGIGSSNQTPLIKKDFVENVPNDYDLSTYRRRYTIPIATTPSSSALIPPFRHRQSNRFALNDYYPLIEGRYRQQNVRSNARHTGKKVAGKYGFWDGQNKSFDPVVLQLMFTHHESIFPEPHFWGYRGYGLYSFAAGNDLHNNLPNGGYKVERDFDN